MATARRGRRGQGEAATHRAWSWPKESTLADKGIGLPTTAAAAPEWNPRAGTGHVSCRYCPKFRLRERRRQACARCGCGLAPTSIGRDGTFPSLPTRCRSRPRLAAGRQLWPTSEVQTGRPEGVAGAAPEFQATVAVLNSAWRDSRQSRGAASLAGRLTRSFVLGTTPICEQPPVAACAAWGVKP